MAEGEQTETIKEYWKPGNKVAVFTLLAVLTYTGITLRLLCVQRDTEIRDSRAYVYLSMSAFRYPKPRLTTDGV